MGYNVFGPFDEIRLGDEELIISVGLNHIRKKIVEKLPENIRYGKAIHPSAIISEYAFLGEGTVVMQGAVIQSGVSIGNHCIINTSASVDHDCIIDDYVHISPNATLCGAVSMGEGSQIGAGAVVIPGIKIGKWSLVAAGAVVVKDVPDHVLVLGNPARVVKRINIWTTKEYGSPSLIGGQEQRFIQEAFDTNWVVPLGPNVVGFERDLENYLGRNKHIVALSAGTAAIHLGLVPLGVTQGDEVICQSFTFSASANPIVYQGATPVFIDSETETKMYHQR